MPTISPASPTDISQLADLLELLYAEEAEFTFDRQKQEQGLRLIVQTPAAGQIFLARTDGLVVGMDSLLFTISTAAGGPACWLEDLIVHPDFRGAGLGSQLVSHAREFARGQGCLRISLLTDRTNEAARRFYRRHGFVDSPMAPLRLPLS